MKRLIVIVALVAAGCANPNPPSPFNPIYGWLLAHQDDNCLEYDAPPNSHFLLAKFNGVPPGFHLIDLANCYPG